MDPLTSSQFPTESGRYQNEDGERDRRESGDQPARRQQVELKECSVAMMKKRIREISENGHRDHMP